MVWWVIVGTGHEPGLTDLWVYASTNNPDHLWMSWSYYRPAQQEIWKIVRGKRVWCGYKYIWDTPHIAEQRQSGDTLVHRFHLSGLEAGSQIWYYLHAPYGPAMREIQGPLMHVHLMLVPYWVTAAYFASRTKGMFKTTNFSSPPGPQPTWIPDNAGLPSLDIAQACSDPADPYHSRFVVCHGDVYRMENIFIDEPAIATRVLANWQAVALTGGFPGTITWIAGNHNYPGHFYVLFRSDLGGTGIWSLKTTDFGLSWTAHQVYLGPYSYDSGNIMAGTDQGTSPHDPGHVIYACATTYAGGHAYIFRSLDEGETWAPIPGLLPGISIWSQRLFVDPADQAQVFTGAESAGPDLYRTWNHGATWFLADAGNHLGINCNPPAIYGVMGTVPSNPDAIRVIKESHIWKSSNDGLIWHDQGPTQYDTPHMHFRNGSYDYLYLARRYSAPPPDGLYAQHVLFVSTDEGSNMFGKAGLHPGLIDGGGDSIPASCGGVAQEGFLTLP